MKISFWVVVIVVFVLFSIIASCAEKPPSKIAADGFPTGQATPEGAASDLARAFINGDAGWFRKVCIRPYGAGQSRAEYTTYLDGVSDHLKQAPLKMAPDGPRKIIRVYAARHLTKSGPASYGYAALDFQDVMFVDLEVVLESGKNHLRRTMVIMYQDGLWYVHPVPDISPLLSDGLYEESASTKVFTIN